MLRAILWLSQAVVALPALYSSMIALFGLATKDQPVVGGQPRIRVRAVVPAHNEEAVVEGIARDLEHQTHPSRLLSSVVIADRCTDRTAELARTHVPVAEREEGSATKGAAIDWYLGTEPLGPREILLILDADNRIDDDYVARVAAAFERGAEVVQTYLDVANPDGSPLATANALTYWASNRMVQLARSNLGWSCDLGGTGMAVTGAALAEAGGFTDDLADDLSLNIRLNLAGYETRWLHDARVRDEKPVGTRSTVTQRARWVRGKRLLARRYGWTLIRSGVVDRRPGLIDLAYRLLQPGRSFLALLLGVFTAAAIVWPDAGWWSPWLLGGMTAIVVLLPVFFLIVDGVPARYIVRYPLVTLLALLWLPIRVASRLMPGWRRTSHAGG
ncbi:MAG: glycosyltransferase family 2 protein [Acidimicrobiia bacterium]